MNAIQPSWQGVIIALNLALTLAGGSFPVWSAVIMDCRQIEAMQPGVDALELSGIGFAADESVLYAVGDDGNLFRFAVTFEGTTLGDIAWLDRTRLRAADGRALHGDFKDSEGLAVQYGEDGEAGNTILWISFEQTMRLCRYTPEGDLLDCPRLPPPLQDRSNYRQPNAGLESVAWWPGKGIYTAPEYPLRRPRDGERVLYALHGRHYKIQPHEASAAVTGIEVLPDGRILVLERDYRFFRLGVQATLLLYAEPGLETPPQVLLDEPALPPGNFEGIARHGSRHAFIVNDDNRFVGAPTWLLYIALFADGEHASCR